MQHDVPASPARILVVEDDPASRHMVAAAIAQEAFEVDTASDGDSALALATATEYAVILLDLMLPGRAAFEFLELFSKTPAGKRTMVLVMAAYDDRVVERLEGSRVHGILRKPFDVPKLVAVLYHLLRLQRQPSGARGS